MRRRGLEESRYGYMLQVRIETKTVRWRMSWSTIRRYSVFIVLCIQLTCDNIQTRRRGTLMGDMVCTRSYVVAVEVARSSEGLPP